MSYGRDEKDKPAATTSELSDSEWYGIKDKAKKAGTQVSDADYERRYQSLLKRYNITASPSGAMEVQAKNDPATSKPVMSKASDVVNATTPAAATKSTLAKKSTPSRMAVKGSKSNKREDYTPDKKNVVKTKDKPVQAVKKTPKEDEGGKKKLTVPKPSAAPTVSKTKKITIDKSDYIDDDSRHTSWSEDSKKMREKFRRSRIRNTGW